MELADVVSSAVSLVVGFLGALMGVRTANVAYARDRDAKRLLALRNYERALTDMALYLEGVGPGLPGGHPRPKDLDETRQAAFPYFGEFDRDSYYALLSPDPLASGNPYADAESYSAAAKIIKDKLDSEKSKKSKQAPLNAKLSDDSGDSSRRGQGFMRFFAR